MTGDHPLIDRDIAEHYAGTAERGRLSAGSNRLEFLRTRDLLARHLPSPPARILDVGGAAGVYALPLAAQGYAVTLVDPLARHVEQARAASAAQPGTPLAGVELGDARSLTQPDASFDAVLLLGPLYHLVEQAERIAALAEARRVVRPAGLVAAAGISRFASLIDGLVRNWLEDPAFARIMERDLTDGQHHNPSGHPAWFTTAFFTHPDELAHEVRAAGLTLTALVGVEGIAWKLADLDARLDDPTRRSVLLRGLRRVEAEPSLLGASPHLLALARR